MYDDTDYIDTSYTRMEYWERLPYQVDSWYSITGVLKTDSFLRELHGNKSEILILNTDSLLDAVKWAERLLTGRVTIL